ncbi:MAG: PKD domain-containing protein, partial [Candidatus Parabeggiatoa sp.]|nr:PKD domain-containing protein [Candidatus Parabeggiatoa sp.]
TTVLVKPEPVTPPPPAPPVNVVNEEDTKGEGLTVGKKITLNAGDNPDIIEYKWTTSSGKVFYGQKPTLSFKEPGDYSVNLTVTDKHGLSTTTPNVARVNVPPPAAPPVVPAIAEPIEQSFTNSEGKPVKQVRLSAGDDPNIVEYKWQASNGEIAYGKQPLFLFDTPGEHTIGLTVKDKNGQTATAKKVATVTIPRKDDGGSGGSDKPLDIEKVKVSPSEDDSESVLELDASELGDIEDKYVKWEAINDKGEIIAQAIGKETTLSLPPGTGTYRIQMKVEDEGGVIRAQSIVATATTEEGGEVDVRKKTDSGETVPPPSSDVLKAVISKDIEYLRICPQETITLDGRGSEGQIKEHKWIFLDSDGLMVNEPLYGSKTQWISPEKPGKYTITLEIIGHEGGSDDDIAVVTVRNDCSAKACYDATLMACKRDKPDDCPEAVKEIGIMADSRSKAFYGNIAENWFLKVDVDASCSTGAINYEWELDSNPVGSNSISSTIELDKKDNYTLSLRITDEKGHAISKAATQTINVGKLVSKVEIETNQVAIGEEIQMDSVPSNLGVYSDSDSLKYKWSMIGATDNAPICGEIRALFTDNTTYQTQISFSATASIDLAGLKDAICIYTPRLELTDPMGVMDVTNDEDTTSVTLTWRPIPRIKIIEPKIVEVGARKVGRVKLGEKHYYGDTPMKLILDASLSKSSLNVPVPITEYTWESSCEVINDVGDIVKNTNKGSKEEFDITLTDPGECTITLMVKDENGLESGKPDTLKFTVGPLLKFVLSGAERSSEAPDRLIAQKKLGDRLNLGFKLYFNPTLVRHCAEKNEAGEFDRVLDLYAAIVIPGKLAPTLLKGAPEVEAVTWFNSMHRTSDNPMGLKPIDAEQPFTPFIISFDFQKRHFSLMDIPIEGEAWLGTHYLALAVGIFGEDLKNRKNNEDAPVCLNPYTANKDNNQDIVVIELVELQVEEYSAPK